jgi:hypothetical protein
MTKLPVLLPSYSDDIDGIDIATPCEVAWDSLRGDARVRHCGKCKQNVYNIEAMSRGEALRLVAAGEGRVCLRIFRRPDGTVVTADCRSRLRAARARGIGAFMAVLVVAGLAQLAAMAFGLLDLRRLTHQGRTMGAPAPVRMVSVTPPGLPTTSAPPPPVARGPEKERLRAIAAPRLTGVPRLMGKIRRGPVTTPLR